MSDLGSKTLGRGSKTQDPEGPSGWSEGLACGLSGGRRGSQARVQGPGSRVQGLGSRLDSHEKPVKTRKVAAPVAGFTLPSWCAHCHSRHAQCSHLPRGCMGFRNTPGHSGPGVSA
eukprot:379089-Rhodomonas_salina.1